MNLANSFVVFATRECVAVRFAWLWLSLPGAGKMLYLPPSRGQVARSRMQRSVRSLRWIELHLCRGFLSGPEVVVAPLVGKFRSGRCSGHPRAAHRVHDLVPADGTLIPAAWRVPFGLWTV